MCECTHGRTAKIGNAAYSDGRLIMWSPQLLLDSTLRRLRAVLQALTGGLQFFLENAQIIAGTHATDFTNSPTIFGLIALIASFMIIFG